VPEETPPELPLDGALDAPLETAVDEPATLSVVPSGMGTSAETLYRSGHPSKWLEV
jgi:hypothetical protein